MQKKEEKMFGTNKRINELNRVVGQYKRSGNKKSAQIRFYKLQLKAIKERIEKILEMDKPIGHHNFDFVRKKKE